MALSRLRWRKSFDKAERAADKSRARVRLSSPKGAECRHVHSIRLPGAFSLVKHFGVQPHQSFGPYPCMIKTPFTPEGQVISRKMTLLNSLLHVTNCRNPFLRCVLSTPCRA
jgi:hypothetical protein